MHGVDGNPLALWCDKLGVRLISSEARPPDHRRARLGQDAHDAAAQGLHGRRGVQYRDRLRELEEQVPDERARARARSRSRMRSSRCCTRRWLPEVDRLVIATFVEGSEGVNGSVWDQLSAEEWFPTEGLDGNAQPKGGFHDADRRCRARARHPAQRAGDSACLEREHGVAATLAERRAHRGRPRRDHLAGRPVARRALPPRSAAAARAAGRDRPAGLRRRRAGQDLSALPARFWPEKSKWFGRLPDAPDRRGTFNTFVSHVEETGLPILLSFANGHSAVRYDREIERRGGEAGRRSLAAQDVRPQQGAGARGLRLSALAHRSLDDGRLFLSRDRQPARGPRRSCPAARQPCVLRRRGDRAGRVRHRACRLVVGRADGRGAVPAADRRRDASRDMRPWAGRAARERACTMGDK